MEEQIFMHTCSQQTRLPRCDEDDFPNISVLLAIACTLPVTTMSCETDRSNSQLKLLKTYNRSTMTQERLTSFAMVKIQHDIIANLDFDNFANRHPRRMALPCVFSLCLCRCYIFIRNVGCRLNPKWVWHS